jgi:hypothetical protein
MDGSMNEIGIGRLALRVEGDWWEAYYALPNTMEGAIPLGRIRMSIVRDRGHKEAFQALMWAAVADILEEKTGQRPEAHEQPAPESERAGWA